MTHSTSDCYGQCPEHNGVVEPVSQEERFARAVALGREVPWFDVYDIAEEHEGRALCSDTERSDYEPVTIRSIVRYLVLLGLGSDERTCLAVACDTLEEVEHLITVTITDSDGDWIKAVFDLDLNSELHYSTTVTITWTTDAKVR